jgi:peptidoglycan/xylan/chitin deacetylase (PgdA/CDA1 family)
MSGVAYLMYHEIERPGVDPARDDAGYLRYVISTATFGDQLAFLARSGKRGISTGQAVAADNDLDDAVAITFDDGCASDLAVAAPKLAEHGWTATFYVTVDHVDRPGFLSRGDVRELADRGFEIGSHALTHRYLTGLDAAELDSELLDSRHWLEDVIGRDVRHFSCPGGRWSQQVAERAAESGYESVAVSRPVANTPGSDPFQLGRFAVTTATDARTFQLIMNARLPLAARCLQLATSLSRSVLGDRRYDRLRDRLLRP